MAFLGLHEQMLFIATRKNQVNSQLSRVQMDLLTATKLTMKEQQTYTEELKEIYNEYYADFRDEYTELYTEINVDYQNTLDRINSWQSQIELQKETLELELSELTNFEQSWQKLEGNCIKTDFTYGGGGGGGK